MSHSFPIDDIADGIVNRILTRRATFTPALKVVTFDQHWAARLATVSEVQLLERIPAVYVQQEIADDFNSGDENAIQMSFPFFLNFVYPLITAARIEALPVGRKLAELFSVGEQLDDIPELYSLVGEHLARVEVTGMGFNSALEEWNVGWYQVGIRVHLLSE